MRLTHLRLRYHAEAGGAPAGVVAATWVSSLAPLALPEWRPPCDVIETREGWTVRVELGGLDDEDIEVLLYEDSLVVQGERRWRAGDPDVRVHVSELRYGAFRLTVNLPAPVERGAARAGYERGILTVVLPRAREPAV